MVSVLVLYAVCASVRGGLISRGSAGNRGTCPCGGSASVADTVGREVPAQDVLLKPDVYPVKCSKSRASKPPA